MGFRRLSLMLRLPLTVLICSLLVCVGGNFPPDDYLAALEKVEVPFNESDDKKSSYVGLPVVIFKDALIQHSGWVSLDLVNVSQGAPLELRATGPPKV